MAHNSCGGLKGDTIQDALLVLAVWPCQKGMWELLSCHNYTDYCLPGFKKWNSIRVLRDLWEEAVFPSRGSLMISSLTSTFEVRWDGDTVAGGPFSFFPVLRCQFLCKRHLDS